MQKQAVGPPVTNALASGQRRKNARRDQIGRNALSVSERRFAVLRGLRYRPFTHATINPHRPASPAGALSSGGIVAGPL